jgi:hypothetical protein
VIELFFKVLRELSQENLSMLLAFTAGSPQVPAERLISCTNSAEKGELAFLFSPGKACRVSKQREKATLSHLTDWNAQKLECIGEELRESARKK